MITTENPELSTIPLRQAATYGSDGPAFNSIPLNGVPITISSSLGLCPGGNNQTVNSLGTFDKLLNMAVYIVSDILFGVTRMICGMPPEKVAGPHIGHGCIDITRYSLEE
jgi:hypothetical protein